MPLQRHIIRILIILTKWENLDYFLYPGGVLNHSQNSMGSKLDQDPSFDFFLMKF